MTNLITPSGPSQVEVGACIGQIQAFRWMTRHCSAAGARHLKKIREDRAYESLGLTWEQFCLQHAGISRAYADKLIKRLDEFGEPYFQLSGIARISPESYRLLAPAVTPEGIEIEGESVPLTPENAPRIRKAVEALRAELGRAQQTAPDPRLTHLVIQLDACFDQMAHLGKRPDAGTRAGLRGLINYCVNKLKSLEKSLDFAPQ